MFRIPLPFSDHVLLLSPRGEGLDVPLRLGLLLACALVPALLVSWLYRRELRLVSRRVALGLLSLRLLVLFLLFSVVCLQPIVSHTATEELPGQVLVAFDRSASMDVADPQRPAVDKLRLARALRLASDLVAEQQLDEWIRQYEVNGPQWVVLEQYPFEQVCRRVDQLTRSDLGRRVLVPEGGRLLDAVGARHQVELLGFAGDTWELQPTALAGTDRAAGDPRFAVTDLRLPLECALGRAETERGKVLGVVLLTDGQHNRGRSPVPKAVELGEQKLPVYPVALGPRQAPPDVALAGLRAPTTVFKDADAWVEARVKVSGLPAQDLTVELQRPNAPPVVEHLRHDGTDRFHTVRFPVQLAEPGSQTLTVTVRPVAGELRTDNNSRPVVIQIADDKAKVLLIDGEARWEYHYLANALARDRMVDAQSIVFAQPRLGRIAEEELVKSGNPRRTLPAEPDAFGTFDCIVLGDVSAEQLPPAERVRLEQYVADRGGTLVIVAGKRFMPLDFLKGFVGDDMLLKLLPIEQPRAVVPSKGFPVTRTHEGRLAPFLQLETTTDKNEQWWAELPPHFWGVVGRTKPGAVPLAFVMDDEPARGEAQPRENTHALIVRQNYGFGRVLFVGLDSTWRWRWKAGDTYHHRFWGQVIRWAASDKPLVAGNEHVRFGAREPAYRQGAEAEIVVRLAESAGPLAPDLLAGARVVRQSDGQTAAAVPLARRDVQPRVLEGRVRDLPAGTYAVELDIPELAGKLTGPPGPDGRLLPLRAGFTVTPFDGDELIELGTNWPLLEELAAKSGGRVFTLDTVAQLADLLGRQSVTREYHTESKLWQSWGTLLVFLLLLSAEWVGRKLAGLP